MLLQNGLLFLDFDFLVLNMTTIISLLIIVLVTSVAVKSLNPVEFVLSILKCTVYIAIAIYIAKTNLIELLGVNQEKIKALESGQFLLISVSLFEAASNFLVLDALNIIRLRLYGLYYFFTSHMIFSILENIL